MASPNNMNQMFYENASSNYIRDIERQHFEDAQRYYMERMQQQTAVPQEYLQRFLGQYQQPEQPSGEKTLTLIKKSIKQIKAEAVSEEAQKQVGDKIERLKKFGITTQAQILEQELKLRIKLARVQEWDYKVLPYDAIKEFESINKMTATKDGLKVHINSLDKYCGIVEGALIDEAKDKIIPDFVLDKIEEAKDRQIFDEFNILWVEKVKDPLLLGSIKGCKDYFFICEWGEDIKFEDLIKPKEK